jgi:serine/threonine protein kinase
MKEVALKRRAQPLDADNEIAVKKVMIQEEMTEARRVFREIKILQNMNHPNVLKIINIVSVRAPQPHRDPDSYDGRS